MNTSSVLDTDEYPTRWPDYIGQEPATRMLRVASASARLRKEPLDHVLIAHPSPGIGKTALATMVSRELRRPIRAVSGKVTLGAARLILSEMNDRDVLFYDEFHRVAETRGNAEWLLHLMQDNTLMGPFGVEKQPRITLIAATTHAHLVPPAVLDRFMLVPTLGDYTIEEAARIAQVTARRVLRSDEFELPKLNKREAATVAMAAGRNPRAIKKLLISLRDITVTKAVPLVKGRYDVAALLEWNDITPDGLTLVARRYLSALKEDFDGSAGARALEERLAHPGGLADVERVLMDAGLVGRTKSGRMLTQAGIARYNQLSA